MPIIQLCELPCKWGNIPFVVHNLDTAMYRASGREQRWWCRFSCRSQSVPHPGRVIGRLCRRYQSYETYRIATCEWGNEVALWSFVEQRTGINEPLPSAITIFRCDRYNWAPRDRRLGHRSRVRWVAKGRCIIVCIRNGDRYRCRGWELRVRVNFLSDDLKTIIVTIYFSPNWRNKIAILIILFV